MRIPRFSLSTLFVAMTLASLLLWANLQERVVVSEMPPYLRDFTWEASVYVYSGWPIYHRRYWYLIPKNKLREFVPDEWGAYDEKPLTWERLLVNVAAGCLLIGTTACATEWIVRRSRAVAILGKTSRSPRGSA